MKKLIAVSAVVLSTFGSTIAQQAVNTKKLDSLFNALDAHHKMMGTVTIAKDGKPVYTRSIGAYKIEGGKELKANAQTVYRIGSISKMFTAVMIFQLIEEKKLTLDTKLSKFFPEVHNAEQISIEQLLNHHSGIFNFTNAPDYTTWYTQPKTKQEILSKIYKLEPAFEPGAKAEYSNTNFVLLGYIVEQLTGMPYKDALKKRITDKLGLKHTYYGGKIKATANEASSYSYETGKWEEEPETDMSIPGGAGAVVSTTEDLDKFIAALFDKKLASETSLNAMMTITDKFGMGLHAYPLYTDQVYGHTGAIDGFHSMLFYRQKDKVSFAVTINGSNYVTNDVAIGVMSIYDGRTYTIPTFDEKTVKADASLLEKYSGEYSSKLVPLKITLKNENGQLTAQATGQDAFQLEAVSNSEFKFDDAGIRMKFNKKEGSDNYNFTLLQGGASILFEKE